MKQILEAAATLPPAKGRALLGAIAGKQEDAPQDSAALLSDAAVLMEAAMIEAALKTLEVELS